MGRIIVVLLLSICILALSATDAASKRLECRINPRSNPWKKQSGGFPGIGTLPTLVVERLVL
jgi:hypothetical protein